MAALPLGTVWCVAVALLLWTPARECNELAESVITNVNKINEGIALLLTRSEKVEYRLNKLKSTPNVVNDSGIEKLKELVAGLDNRLANMENKLGQREEREKTTQRQTNEALAAITTALQTLTSTVESLKKNTTEENVTNDDSLQNRLTVTDSKIDEVKDQIENMTKNISEERVRSMCLSVVDMSPLGKHVADAAQLLKSYEGKLAEYSVQIGNLNEVTQADEAMHNNITEDMKLQSAAIAQIQKVLSDAESVWKELPKLSDFNSLQVGTNQTLDAVIKATENLNQNSAESMDRVTTEVRGLSERMVSTNASVHQSISQGVAAATVISVDITRGLSTLRSELHPLVTKNNRLLLTISQDVQQNKKSSDYAASRILAQVSLDMRKLSTAVQDTIKRKLDAAEVSIITNQTESNTELGSGINRQLIQTWRQISVMDRLQQDTKKALDLLTEHTEQYANSNAKTMDKIKYDVDLTSERIRLLGDSLNTALGDMRKSSAEFQRLASVVTDYFTPK